MKLREMMRISETSPSGVVRVGIYRMLVALVVLQILHTGLMAYAMYQAGDFIKSERIAGLQEGQATVTITQTPAQQRKGGR